MVIVIMMYYLFSGGRDSHECDEKDSDGDSDNDVLTFSVVAGIVTNVVKKDSHDVSDNDVLSFPWWQV